MFCLAWCWLVCLIVLFRLAWLGLGLGLLFCVFVCCGSCRLGLFVLFEFGCLFCLAWACCFVLLCLVVVFGFTVHLQRKTFPACGQFVLIFHLQVRVVRFYIQLQPQATTTNKQHTTTNTQSPHVKRKHNHKPKHTIQTQPQTDHKHTTRNDNHKGAFTAHNHSTQPQHTTTNTQPRHTTTKAYKVTFTAHNYST